MKKGINISIVVLLAASTLAACSSSSKEKPAADSASPSAPAGPTKFSISFMTTTGGTGYYTKQSDLSKEKWVLALNKLTNTEISPRVIEEAKMPVMFAGNDIPDVVGSTGLPTSKNMSGSVEAGVFQPLDELLKKYGPNLLKTVPKSAWDAVSYKGKIYGLPAYLSNPSRRGTFIRTDLLAKTGLPAPKTVDDFLNVLRTFKKLGVENPYQMRENLKYADIILGAFDVLPYRDQFEVVNGQVQPKFLDVENMQKALQTYKTMYDEGLIAKDFATITSTDYGKNINAGKVGIWSQNVAGLPGYRKTVANVDSSAKIDIIPSPKGPEGKGGYFYYSPVIQAEYINKNVKPETAAGIIKFFDWMVTPEAEKFFSFGIEGQNYTVQNGNINFTLPKTQDEIDEDGWRSGTLWTVHDATMNRMRLALDPDGKDTINALDNVASNEGLGGIGFNPDLTAFSTYPDLASQQDAAPKLIMDHIIKMIYGKEPISDWPKVIEEYKSKGGNEIIKEATTRYNNKDGVVTLSK